MIGEDQREQGDVRTEQQARFIRYIRDPEFVPGTIVSHTYSSEWGLEGKHGRVLLTEVALGILVYDFHQHSGMLSSVGI